ncbi:MAG TPA: helix-turn-helix domain-containing protein [Kiritimatiellia bacterium]|nr:helix-turn-helix domain-containing protein [Kiritimatiellia bacterium]
MALHPTLWRTCRVLAGPTRLRLLRRVIARPGLTVQQLADAQGIGKSRASQELRRLQSRGLIQARRESARVAYHPVPDPLVATAKPLLEAMKTAFASTAPRQDRLAIGSAVALAYPRRQDIVRHLLDAPASVSDLAARLRIPRMSTLRHLHALRDLDLARNVRGRWHFTPNAHPLTRCLIRLLQQEPAPPPS